MCWDIVDALERNERMEIYHEYSTYKHKDVDKKSP